MIVKRKNKRLAFMASISLCMIVKNEEDVLERCLNGAKGLADEIVVVDTGSADSTKEIAAGFTDRIYDFEWRDDFAAARNFAFSKGTMDYLMWLDADDVIPESEKGRLLELKERLSREKIDVAMLKYEIAFDSQGNSTFSFYRERIVRRCRLARWEGRVHEAVTPFGRVVREPIRIEHRKIKVGDPGRNLRIFERMRAEGVHFCARDLYYYGKELYYHKRYYDAVRIFEKFLSRTDGGEEDRLDACRHMAYCQYGLGEKENALKAFLSALEFSVPTAELCCDLGLWFFREERYVEAAFWYLQALGDRRKDGSCGFIQEDCHGYLPYLQLCACYDRMGERRLAVYFNEMAERWKPGSPACEYNREYFSKQGTAKRE